jgi:hypothetical protein
MGISVIRPAGGWSTTRFTDLAAIQAGGAPIGPGKGATVPRAVDWDGDGKPDLLVGAAGGVWLYRNVGQPSELKFAPGRRVQAAGKEIALGSGRVSIACADMDADGRVDLVAVPESDRRVRWYRDEAAGAGEPVLSAERRLEAKGGGEFVAGDVRVELADWDGDRLPDLLIGSRSGQVMVARNVGTPKDPLLDAPAAALDAAGLTIEGSYNINLRVADVNQDGLPDLIDTYNWGNVNFRINAGTAARPLLGGTGQFSVSGPASAAVDLHALCDGPIVDAADLDGDGTLDLVAGGEIGGRVHLAKGQSARSYLEQIEGLLAARPRDLAAFLADPANAAAKGLLASLEGALYDYVAGFATPGQKDRIADGLLAITTGSMWTAGGWRGVSSTCPETGAGPLPPQPRIP